MPTEEEKQAAERAELWIELKRLWCHRMNAREFDLPAFMMLVDEQREHDHKWAKPKPAVIRASSGNNSARLSRSRSITTMAISHTRAEKPKITIASSVIWCSVCETGPGDNDSETWRYWFAGITVGVAPGAIVCRFKR